MQSSLSFSSLSSAMHLRIDGISISFGDRRVLTDVSVVVASGQRTGLIGENGSGKSTLLRIAAGLTIPDAGSVNVLGASGITPRIGLLHQAHSFSETDTIGSALASSVAPAREAAANIDICARRISELPDDRSVANAYADALERAERLGAWDIDARISSMLSGLGLGLGSLSLERYVKDLSGGQRARLTLAWLLLSRPDVLLLDEPTNHLDDAATEHLRLILTTWPGPVLFASHDRAFLDETATGLIDLDPTPIPQTMDVVLVGDGTGTGIGTTYFGGTYSDYLLSRADARVRWENRFRDEQAELKRLRATVGSSQSVGHQDWKPRSEVRMAQKFYADRNAKVVSWRVNDARSRLEDREGRQVRKPPAVLRFSGLSAASVSEQSLNTNSMVSLVDATVRDRLAPVSLKLRGGEKLMVTGPNGTGKSTLLHLIAGDVNATGGHVDVCATARVALLTQKVSLPDPYGRGTERTVNQTYIDLVGSGHAELRPLSTFGLIARRDENRELAVLSLGQKRRLALAVILANPPEILLLDEPTNHLSLLLATDLEAAIAEYQGTVIVASHDRWLRKRWIGEHLELRKQRFS